MRDWLKDVSEIDKDCILRWEYLLGRKLSGWDEYCRIDSMLDDMVLDWWSRREFYKDHPEFKEFR